MGYWRLNEAGKTSGGNLVAVDAQQEHDGTYGSASTDGVPGPLPANGFSGFDAANTAVEFTNGLPRSYVTLPALNLNTNAVTITAWVYPKGTPAAYSGIVFCRNANDASGFCFTDNGQIGYTWNQNNSDTWAWMSGLVPPSGKWSFIALVVSPGSAVAYLCNANGQFSATNAIAHTAEAFTSDTLIGGDNDDGGSGGRTFNGVMDEVAIFNSSLTQSQILGLYFNAVGGTPRVGPTKASPSSTVFADTTVTLSATVLGPGPFSYQWQANGADLPGATNATLVLTSATESDDGIYDVVVNNLSGAGQSAPLVLTVTPPAAPVFTQEPTPAAVTAYVGGLVQFSAAVSGSPPIQLQWQHNGINIPNATSSGLALASIQPNEAGSYTLTAASALGTTNSSPAVLTVLPPPNAAALNVLTYHNDNTRQGANTNEVLLTLANVNVTNFGRLMTYPVDGYIYTQPLYVANLVTPGQGTHNAVFVATEHNSVYAFDADNNTGTNAGLLWQTNLGTSALSSNHEFGGRYHGGDYTDIVPEVGITGTPVIDLASGTLFVDVRTRLVGATTKYYHSIHALNLTNGAEQPYSPVIVTNSVPGKGVDNIGGVVRFNPLQENQRPGLTLAGGMLYVAYGSFADTDPYHGWVIGFNATNLQTSASYVFNTTPNATVAAFGANAGEGALWMGGNGLCVDDNTNLYFETANGSFSANTGGGDYSDSFVRLSTTNGLKVADYFTPYNQLSLAEADEDLGSGGPILLPDATGSAAHPHLIVGAGKEGTLHLVDRDNMGHYNSANDSQIVQEVPGAIGSAFSTPAYFNHQIYYQGVGDVTKGFLISNGVIKATPLSQAATSFSALGGTPSISANGASNGIVWTIQSDAFASSGPAVLHAYNATNLAQELYNSSQNAARDNPGGAIQMTTPTVVNGKVFVGAQYALSIFGNSLFLATPAISPNGGLFTNSVTVTLSDATPNSAFYYTLDGTTPTTNSTAYTGPFVLTTSATVQAIAAQSGAANSGVATAGFIDSAAIGNGVGLLGDYWAITSGTAFTNSVFDLPPTLMRTDAVVNFNWSSAGPSTFIGRTNFAVRWTGCLQPAYSETYTFTTISQDGARLWVNGQLVISAWTTNASAQTNGGAITLRAQQLYNIQLDYFQNTGPGAAELLWSSPSTPQAVIPRTQLYPYTNPPPAVVLSAPNNGSIFTAPASVSLTADADALYNTLSAVGFYTNGGFAGSVTNRPYAITITGLSAGDYMLAATAVDGSGLSSTSMPVSITISAGGGLPYGLNTNATLAPFLNQNMPGSFAGAMPALLSQTGAFANTSNRDPAAGLISYAPNTPLWSDGAVKSRYLGLPNSGGLLVPTGQIGFAPAGPWSFPSGTVFVKNFDLVVNQTNAEVPLRRLETRLLVRDTNGAVYGVTYKWRPDNSDADLLATSLTETILVTNASGVVSQQWYYPSPADCLTCHTPVAGYVLGVNTRQLNGSNTYTAAGVTDNQLRTLNHLGLFYPAFDEAGIANFEQLSSVTNLNATLVQRARSYLDANCSQCHQPGGTGITFDARYDTPLTNQNIINAAAAFSLGYDNAKIVAPSDVWRSVLYDRMNSLPAAIKMPPLARNLIDTNAVTVMAGWINGLGGTPALPPPTLSPAPGIFTNQVTLALLPPDPNASLYYTLDGSLPTTNSILYSGPFPLASSAVVTANAFEANYVNSVAVSGLFTIVPPLYNLFAPGILADGSFQAQYWGPAGQTYILQTSTDLVNWLPVITNVPATAPFVLVDPGAAAAPYRYYRVITP
ncbi:MAG: chitobiase/beta-hexosaminidase C-terminal domain-containing protein [Limisphaerales bacterium]